MCVNSIRKSMQARRSQLSARHLDKTGILLKNNLESNPLFIKCSKIAAYIAVGGEIDPNPIMKLARDLGKSTFLPIISGELLRFAPVTSSTIMRTGKFKIPIPDYKEADLLSPENLDLVLVPLVAFDKNLNRLGMGGGFYDKSFSFRANNTNKPYLLGVAHSFQKTTSLLTQPWDIPMDQIITEERTHYR